MSTATATPSNYRRFTFVGDDHRTGYAETDDPRLVAIIERDDDAQSPDYDAQAPTLLGYEWGSRADFTQIGGKSDVPDAWLKARLEYGDEDTADRFVKIFYDATAHHLRSGIDQYTWAVVFDAPDWRTDMGIDPDTTLDRDDLTGEVAAYLDNDVYGIGYAVNEARTTTETPVDFDDADQNWQTEIECWGFYGDEYAARSALNFDHGKPNLDLMLDHTEPINA